MSFSGADVEAVRALAGRFDRQASRLREVASSSSTALMVAEWTGAGIDQLRARWKRETRPALLALASQLSEEAVQLRREADTQVEASRGVAPARSAGLTTRGGVQVRELTPAEQGGVPCSLGSIIEQTNAQYDRGQDAVGQVGIRTIENADGTRSHIVMVPGTQDWMGVTGNPFDADAAVSAGLGRQTRVASLVREAMARAGIEPDEPVMLVGHSLGGLEVGNLAADAGFRSQYRIQSVVAYGADISSRDIPADTQVLQFLNGAAEPVGLITAGAGRLSGSRSGPASFLTLDSEFAPMPSGLSVPTSAGSAAWVAKVAAAHGEQAYRDAADRWGEGFGSSADRDRWNAENANFLCAENSTSTYRQFGATGLPAYLTRTGALLAGVGKTAVDAGRGLADGANDGARAVGNALTFIVGNISATIEAGRR